MRYQTNGALDTQWGQGGRVHGAFPGISRAYLTGLALDSSGLLLASGRSWNDVGTSGYDFLTARYLANGSLDATYGGACYVFSNLDGDDQPSSCGLQADGSFVQSGMVSGFAVATRRLADGSLDAAYGTAGFSESAPLSGPFVRSVAIDAGRRVVMAAESAGGGALVRYRAN